AICEGRPKLSFPSTICAGASVFGLEARLCLGELLSHCDPVGKVHPFFTVLTAHGFPASLLLGPIERSRRMFFLICRRAERRRSFTVLGDVSVISAISPME